MTFGFEVKQILYFRKDFMIRKIRNFFNDYSIVILAILANIFGRIMSEQYFFREFFTDKYFAGLFFLFLYFLIVIIFEWNLVKRIIRNKIPRLSVFDSLFFSELVLFMLVTYVIGSDFLKSEYTDSWDYGFLSSGVFCIVVMFFSVIESIWRDI